MQLMSGFISLSQKENLGPHNGNWSTGKWNEARRTQYTPDPAGQGNSDRGRDYNPDWKKDENSAIVKKIGADVLDYGKKLVATLRHKVGKSDRVDHMVL